MTFEKTNDLLALQALMGGGYNRNGTKPIPNEIQRKHGQQAVNQLANTLKLERTFGFTARTKFSH